MSDLTGIELLRFWRASGLSQREFAKLINMPFNSMHGKLYRTQKKLDERRPILQKKQYEPVLMKAAVFDIETMDFMTGGVRQHMVCGSVLGLDSDNAQTVALKFSDNGNDQRLLSEFLEMLYQYDILIGHNIAAFDFNWIKSRLLYHNMDQPKKRWAYYDTFQASKRMAIKAQRKSLGHLGDFFRLDGGKTSVFPVAWGMIDSRDENEFNEAISEIVYHCEQDVFLNRGLFFALYPRDRSMTFLPITKGW